jgi:hypothetical protein
VMADEQATELNARANAEAVSDFLKLFMPDAIARRVPDSASGAQGVRAAPSSQGGFELGAIPPKGRRGRPDPSGRGRPPDTGYLRMASRSTAYPSMSR